MQTAAFVSTANVVQGYAIKSWHVQVKTWRSQPENMARQV